MTWNPPPAPYGDPPRRSGPPRGVRIILGVLAVSLVTCGLGSWVFLSSERGRHFVREAHEAAETIQAVTQAPGAADLRGRGCTEAAVASSSQLLEVMEPFLPLEQMSKLREELEAETVMVICQIDPGSLDAPDCAQVARAYLEVVDVQADFWVVVPGPENEGGCQGTYSPAGERLGDIEGLEQPRD